MHVDVVEDEPPAVQVHHDPWLDGVRRVEPGRNAAGVDVPHGGDALAVGCCGFRPRPLAVGRDVEAGFERLERACRRLDGGPGLGMQRHAPILGPRAQALDAESAHRSGGGRAGPDQNLANGLAGYYTKADSDAKHAPLPGVIRGISMQAVTAAAGGNVAGADISFGFTLSAAPTPHYIPIGAPPRLGARALLPHPMPSLVTCVCSRSWPATPQQTSWSVPVVARP